MKDKMEDIKKAFATDMADAPADGRAVADASNLPPSSNRGGTEIEDAGAFQEAFECYETYILDGKGNLLGVPLRRGVSDSAFIDQISFSFIGTTAAAEIAKFAVMVSAIGAAVLSVIVLMQGFRMAFSMVKTAK